MLATAKNGSILWDVVTGAILHRFTDHNAAVYQALFSPDGATIFAGGGDNGSILWDVKSSQVIRRYASPSGGAYSAAFSVDGRSILVGFIDGRVSLWRVDSSVESLMAWTNANRYIPMLAFEQQQLYRFTPTCDGNGQNS